VDERLKPGVDPHDYLHGINLASPHHANALHVSNRHALKVHRLSLTQALSVVKISDQRNFSGEKTASPAYQEDEEGQGERTDDYGYSDL
jgi:hypothetical protein